MKLFRFKQKTATLRNRQKVKEGDRVAFIDSDGVKREGIIQRRKFDCIHADTNEVLKKGSLYFLNNSFNPCDYRGLEKC